MRDNLQRVGFEVFTAVVMKSIIFWDMTPCSLLSFNRLFGGTYHLHLQGRRNKFSKNQQRWRRYFTSKRRLKLDGIDGVISQKMILFNLQRVPEFTSLTCGGISVVPHFVSAACQPPHDRFAQLASNRTGRDTFSHTVWKVSCNVVGRTCGCLSMRSLSGSELEALVSP
jgi:hypothetical protein